MAYNTRRSGGEPLNNVGVRRNPPIGNNFVPGGQLPLQNRPPNPRMQHPPNNPNFRPQQPRMPMQQHPNAPPPQQKMPPQPIPAPNDFVKTEDPMQHEGVDDGGKRKPMWVPKKGNKISRKESQRRRNLRLSRILQPKNAVMILNELVKSASYTVTDMPQGAEMNQYAATVLVDSVTHVGHGRSKMEAKSMAAEAALKYIVKNRQYSALATKDADGEEKMELGEDGTPTLPWQQVASFALYKLLNAWGEDPNQTRGDNAPAQMPHNKPAKKMPENAAHMNPLMLMNQMIPDAQFEELARTGNPPNVTFTFKCTVDGQFFNGTGPNKKSAKKMAAFAVCTKILGVQYPPEIYTPPQN